MIEDYINKHTIMGMLSKRYTPFDNWEGFYKNKNRTKVTVFKDFDGDFEEINCSYLFNKVKGYNSTLLISNFNEEFFKLPSREYREIREAKNKWDKTISIQTAPNSILEIIELINKWDELSGKKYMFTRHSGYDRNFFQKYWESEKDNLYSLFFYHNNNLLGYSIVSKIQNDDCFRYVIRKMDISAGRNIGLYIDYKTFENIWKDHNKDFYINWGASSGKVLKYKMKFPVFKTQKVWFCKKRKND